MNVKESARSYANLERNNNIRILKFTAPGDEVSAIDYIPNTINKIPESYFGR